MFDIFFCSFSTESCLLIIDISCNLSEFLFNVSDVIFCISWIWYTNLSSYENTCYKSVQHSNSHFPHSLYQQTTLSHWCWNWTYLSPICSIIESIWYFTIYNRLSLVWSPASQVHSCLVRLICVPLEFLHAVAHNNAGKTSRWHWPRRSDPIFPCPNILILSMALNHGHTSCHTCPCNTKIYPVLVKPSSGREKRRQYAVFGETPCAEAIVFVWDN